MPTPTASMSTQTKCNANSEFMVLLQQRHFLIGSVTQGVKEFLKASVHTLLSALVGNMEAPDSFSMY